MWDEHFEHNHHSTLFLYIYITDNVQSVEPDAITCFTAIHSNVLCF